MNKKRRAEIDRLYEIALWYKNLRETNNETFMPLFEDEHRYLVLKGGGGSGKSIFAGRKILERVTSEPGHRWLVVRKVAKTLRESCFEQLKNQAYEHYAEHIAYIPRGKGSDMYIRFVNGSEIIFAGLRDEPCHRPLYPTAAELHPDGGGGRREKVDSIPVGGLRKRIPGGAGNAY